MLFHGNLDDYFSMTPEADANHRAFMTTILTNEPERVLLAEEDGQILGYIGLEICEKPPIYPITKFVEIVCISVTAAARRKGVGQQLVAAAKEWSQARGRTRLECEVAVKNPVSQKFWKGLGFWATVERCVQDIGWEE